MKKVKLIFVSPDANHNKFYDMDELSTGKFLVTYGRVGSKGSTMEYPMSDWDKIYRDKTRKGYKDVSTTDTVVHFGGSKMDTSTLKPKIRKLLEDLNKYADKTIQLYYEKEALTVSETLVKRAQEIIDNINSKVQLNCNMIEINSLLIRLYTTIPRKMKNVKDYLLKTTLVDNNELTEFRDKMTIEQGLLDVLVSKLAGHQAAATTPGADPSTTGNSVLSILDQIGLEIEEIDSTEEAMLKDMLNESKHKYIEAFKVINKKTQKLFDAEVAGAKNKMTKLLFHGSRSENWLSIIKSGLQLHPNAVTTGKLFNNGIYFADVADKSLGYINGGRWNSGSKIADNWLAVYDVHLGNMMTFKHLKPLESSGSRIDLADYVPSHGYDSFYAEKNKTGVRYNLSRDEYIVYKEAKCTIKYLIYINV